jgi:hypothetical protein
VVSWFFKVCFHKINLYRYAKVNAELRREMREAGLGPYVPIPAQRFIEKADGTSTVGLCTS